MTTYVLFVEPSHARALAGKMNIAVPDEAVAFSVGAVA